MGNGFVITMCINELDNIPEEAKEQMQAAQTAVNGKADENHTQSASTITSGAFAEDVAAYNENRETSSLRNIEIRTSSASGTLQSTNKIICVRK